MDRRLALRVAARYLEGAADALVTIEYVDRLLKVREWSTNGLSVLKRLRGALDIGSMLPFPVAELRAWLQARGVFDEDLDKIDAVKPARVVRKKPSASFEETCLALRAATGKNVVYRGSLELLEHGGAYVEAWKKAFGKLKPVAKAIFQGEARTINLQPPRGTEDASWDLGGVLSLSVHDRKPPSVSILVSTVTHELGHALEEKHHVDLFAPPWGQPPFISDYAEFRPNIEDFAETFRSYVEEPADLKRRAPEKYEAMKRLV